MNKARGAWHGAPGTGPGPRVRFPGIRPGLWAWCPGTGPECWASRRASAGRGARHPAGQLPGAVSGTLPVSCQVLCPARCWSAAGRGTRRLSGAPGVVLRDKAGFPGAVPGSRAGARRARGSKPVCRRDASGSTRVSVPRPEMRPGVPDVVLLETMPLGTRERSGGAVRGIRKGRGAGRDALAIHHPCRAPRPETTPQVPGGTPGTCAVHRAMISRPAAMIFSSSATCSGAGSTRGARTPPTSRPRSRTPALTRDTAYPGTWSRSSTSGL